MKRYFKDWFIIDLVALGIGASLTILYVVFKDAYPDYNSPWMDIWPNISTEIIGVWLSVRIIDALIQKRESKHKVRRAIVSNLIYYKSLCEELLPDMSDFTIRRMINEIKWFKEHHPKREKYLSRDEKKDINGVLKFADEINNKSLEYLKTYEENKGFDLKFELEIKEINKKRDSLIKGINQMLTSIFREKKQLKVELKSISELIQQNKNFFSIEENKTILTDLEKYSSGERHLDIHIKSIYRYKIEPLDKIEEIVRKDKRIPDFSSREAIDNLLEIESKLIESDNSPIILSSIKSIIRNRIKLLELKLEIKNKLDGLIIQVNNAKDNIFEESNPY